MPIMVVRGKLAFKMTIRKMFAKCYQNVIKFIFVFYFVENLDMLDAHYQVIQCDSFELDLNISCENDSTIFIQTIQFGPFSNDSDDSEIYERTNLKLVNTINITGLCNGSQSCFINDTENDIFSLYPALTRKVNISYKCDHFEYNDLGCYEDNKVRLFTGKQIIGTKYMSASICRHFCFTVDNMFPYFGTENGDECFCGYQNESNKFGETNYRQRDILECNTNCAKHGPEKCGRHGLISVYQNKPRPLEYMEIPASEINSTPGKSCNSFGRLTDMNVLSYQITRNCQKNTLETCDDELSDDVCWSKESMSLQQLEQLYSNIILSKFIKINYSCQAPKINEVGQTSLLSNEDDGVGLIGIVIGVVVGACLTVGILTGLCLVKRKRRQSKEKTVLNQRIGDVNVAEANEYVNVQPDAHIYSESRENTYSVVSKSNKRDRDPKLAEENKCFSSADDVYVDTLEGVYDISNKPRYKDEYAGQAIYSHTTEDMYDSTIGNDRIQPDEENAYDQGFHQTTNIEYEISNA